jgi:signal transduction histidine kinase
MGYESTAAMPSWLAVTDAVPSRRRTDHIEDGPPAHRSRRTMRPSGRWRFLADASALLDGSLDFEQTLANTVRLAVPEVADYCIVALAGKDGSAHWAHAAHRDPGGRDLLDRVRARFPLRAGSDHPLATAIRTGQPELVTVDQARDRLDETGMAGVGPLAALSAIATPMIARDRTFGAIFFATTALSGRRYGPRDLELAADVGRRAGHAIDHALLYQAAEEAARVRDSLVAVVAHDLKNPVTTIDLAVRVLLEDDHDHFPDDGEHKIELHAIGAIQRAAARMYRLIHDLLDLSRADEGRLSLDPAPVEPLSLLEDAREAHSTLAAGRGIALEVAAAPSLPHVLADRERIAQVFSNLVGNAIEFTPRGGRVRISALPGEEGVTFAVEDTGSGIATEDLPHVFDRFWQAQKKSHGGTGLGLSIAKAIVEAHGGSIGVESTFGAGARFHFTLSGVPATALPRDAE